MFVKKFNEQLSLFENKKIICSFDGCNNSINSTNSKKDPDSGKFMCNKHFNICCNCNNYFINLLMDSEGNKYCKYCFNEFFKQCSRCDKFVEPENLFINSKGKKEGCINCCKQCKLCKAIISDLQIKEIFGDFYCENCFYDNFSLCTHCNEFESNDHMYYYNDDEMICGDCIRQNYIVCQYCDKLTIKGDIYEYENNNRIINCCAECYDSLNTINNLSSEDKDSKNYENKILSEIKNQPSIIKFINPSEKLKLQIIHQNPDNIKYIENPSEEMIVQAIKQNPIIIRHMYKLSIKSILEILPYLSKELLYFYIINTNRFSNYITDKKQIAYINPYTNKPLKINNKGPILEENPTLKPNPFTGKAPLIPLDKCIIKEITLPPFWEPKPLDQQPENAELLWQAIAKKPWLKNPKIIKPSEGEEDYYLNEYTLKDDEIFDETLDEHGLTWKDRAYNHFIDAINSCKYIEKKSLFLYQIYKLAKKID